MNKFKLSLFAASALCVGGLVATALPASARDSDVSISITLGNAEIGYSDGYYDRERRWHGWNNNDEREWYQRNRRQSYYEMDREQDRDQYRRDWRDGKRQSWRGVSSDGFDGDFTVTLGDVVFGYSDGYYDQNRGWHSWRSDNEREWYRRYRTQSYYHMARDRDSDRYRRDWREGRRQSWRNDSSDGSDVDFTITLGNVVFGYSDGYYDNDRRWHGWRSDNEREWYRRNRTQTYYHMVRDRDRDRYRRDWREGRRQSWRNDLSGGDVGFSVILGNVVFGYSDGYYDNDRRWHRWRNNAERRWYQQNHGRSYYNLRRNQDRHRNRRDWREGRRQDWRDNDNRN